MKVRLSWKAAWIVFLSLVLGGREAAFGEGPRSLTCVVVDATPDFSRLNAVLDDNGATEVDFGNALEWAYTPKPLADTNVGLAGTNDSFSVKTNSEGMFFRTNVVELSYLLNISGRKSELLSLEPVKEQRIRLLLRSDLLSIRGRVVDAEGNPIEGAEVTSTPEPQPEAGDIKGLVRSARSQKDGTFVITNITPANVWLLAGYLRGGDPTEFGQSPFFIKLEAKAERYTGTEKGAVVLPPISEEVLGIAQKITVFANRRVPAGDRVRPVDRSLPEVKGNVISGVVLVLEKKH